jgi:hypothetical protein
MSKSADRGRILDPARIEPKPDKRGPKPIPGPGGRRGFYARPVCVSTTFSRQQRLFQCFEKLLKNQRDFAAPTASRGPRERFGVATFLTYRFASQASSAL